MMFLGCWLPATSYQLLASLVMVSGLLLIAYCLLLLGFRLPSSWVEQRFSPALTHQNDAGFSP